MPKIKAGFFWGILNFNEVVVVDTKVKYREIKEGITVESNGELIAPYSSDWAILVNYE